MTTVIYQGIIKDITLPNDMLVIINNLCSNSVNLDLDRANILEQLLVKHESKEIPIEIVASNYLSLVRDISKSSFSQPILSAGEYIFKIKPAVTIAIVNNFIKDLRQHAALIKHMQHKFNLFLGQTELQIEALAVLAYLVEKRIDVLTGMNTVAPDNEDLGLYSNIFKLLIPYVLPNKILVDIYENCKKFIELATNCNSLNQKVFNGILKIIPLISQSKNFLVSSTKCYFISRFRRRLSI